MDVRPTRAERLADLDRRAADHGLEVMIDAPLARLTSLRVGGPADRLVEVHTRAELLAALRAAEASGVAWFVLGNGTDIVVADAGIRGLVIRNRARRIAVEGTTIAADGGTPMALLVRSATAAGLSGIEFGISIPGTLGGAVWANAGAHGSSIGDCIRSVEVREPASDMVAVLSAADCAFAYRESRFKHTTEVVLGATIELEGGRTDAIAERLATFRAQRLATQPLDEQNAGSVFRNPPGDHAGRLIDEAGLKGLRIGTAEVSRQHANFIVADRGGSAADVRALADEVRRQVADRYGIHLDFEIEFVGDWPLTDD